MKNKSRRAFLIYLVGQGISNFGDSLRFIAVTILIFKLTGSGMTAAFGLILSSLPSIIASPFAGVLGDRTNERRVLVLVDLLRFMTVPLFLYMDTIWQVYLLLIFISLFDVFYGPPKKKFVLNITGKKGALKANSYLAGASGIAYLIGPLTAGFLTDRYGPAPAIIIASFCCLTSCLLTIFAGVACRNAGRVDKAIVPRFSILPLNLSHCNMKADFQEGLRYCFITSAVRKLLLIGFIMGFGIISVNMAFYPFAFDSLRVTARGWSLMITLYYGTNLVAVLLVKYLEKYIKGMDERVFYNGLTIVSIIWMSYAFVTKLSIVLLLQFIEGSVIAVCGILLAARFQVVTERELMARASGTNDIFANMGKLAGMGCAVLLTRSYSFYAVFIFNSAILFLFAISGQISSKWSREISGVH